MEIGYMIAFAFAFLSGVGIGAAITEYIHTKTEEKDDET